MPIVNKIGAKIADAQGNLIIDCTFVKKWLIIQKYETTGAIDFSKVEKEIAQKRKIRANFDKGVGLYETIEDATTVCIEIEKYYAEHRLIVWVQSNEFFEKYRED